MPPKNASSSRRKYTVTLASGDELDIGRIDPGVPVSAEVIDALKRRIMELQDRLDSQDDISEPPAKRARKTPAASAAMEDVSPPKASTSAPTATKAQEKRRKAVLKSLFDQLKKDCKADTCKFQGSSRVLKVDQTVTDLDEFKMIFQPGEIGHLVQPTLDNKPKSTVWMITYGTRAAVESLFADELKPLKGNTWTIGGAPTFAKSIKIGACDVEVLSAELTYQQNTMKLSMKFTVQQTTGFEDVRMGPSMRQSYGGWGSLF